MMEDQDPITRIAIALEKIANYLSNPPITVKEPFIAE